MLFLWQLCSVRTAACVVFKCPQKSYSLLHPSPHCSGGVKLYFIAGSLVVGVCSQDSFAHTWTPIGMMGLRQQVES